MKFFIRYFLLMASILIVSTPGVMTAQEETRNFKIAQPAPSGIWLKGISHIHTSYSAHQTACPTNIIEEYLVREFLDHHHAPSLLITEAENKGLNFIIFTDHNTIEIKKDFLSYSGSNVKLILGMEYTPCSNPFPHMGLYGLKGDDFDSMNNILMSFNYLLKDFSADAALRIFNTVANLTKDNLKGLVVVNHPLSTTYPWNLWSLPKDYDAIEVWCNFWKTPDIFPSNRNAQALVFWDGLLKSGQKIPAVGGVDNFRATHPTYAGIDIPTMHVFSASLDEDSILEGIRKGRVSLTYGAGVKVELLADVDEDGVYGAGDAIIGDTIYATVDKENLKLNFKVIVSLSQEADVSIWTKNGETKIGPANLSPLYYSLDVNPKESDYVRVEVKQQDGGMIGLTNPIYVSPEVKNYGGGTPGGITVDRSGTLYVSWKNKGTITMIPKFGKQVVLIDGLTQPGDLGITSDGRALVVTEKDGAMHRHYFGISGRVIDASGNPLAGGTVTAEGDWGSMKGKTTDNDGFFQIMDIKRAGSVYSVKITIEYEGKSSVHLLSLEAHGQTVIKDNLVFSPIGP